MHFIAHGFYYIAPVGPRGGRRIVRALGCGVRAISWGVTCGPSLSVSSGGVTRDAIEEAAVERSNFTGAPRGASSYLVSALITAHNAKASRQGLETAQSTKHKKARALGKKASLSKLAWLRLQMPQPSEPPPPASSSSSSSSSSSQHAWTWTWIWTAQKRAPLYCVVNVFLMCS